MKVNNFSIDSFDVRHLPIIRTYLEKMNIVEIIDNALCCNMTCSPGRVVMGLVADILSSRSPLYRVKEFFEHQDMETVVGENISLAAFSDTNIGRVLENIFDYGAEKLFTLISIATVKIFDINLTHVHEDTTSVSVWGEYKNSENQDGVTITYGHSKDHRPDLKQFMFSLLCAEHGVPLIGKVENGNSSDKTINNEILTKVVHYMKVHNVEKKDFIYVADSALVTPDNLSLLGGCDQENKQPFITRLPENYLECQRVKTEAVAKNDWYEIGKLSTEFETKNRPSAFYKSYEATVSLENQEFRAIVIHSNTLDKRRQKRIDRQLVKDKKKLLKVLKDTEKIKFACFEDAQKLSKKNMNGTYYQIEWDITEHRIYQSGRVKDGHDRAIKKTQYILKGNIIENTSIIEKLQEKAGCFVLLSNTNIADLSSQDGLKLYKQQYGIEQNFGFLKDPLIVNDLFLKKPKRIEALGMILLLAVMVSRLIERNMLKFLKDNSCTITGWNNRQTKNPTLLMLTSKFAAIHILREGNCRWFSRPLNRVQKFYLQALGVSENIFLGKNQEIT